LVPEVGFIRTTLTKKRAKKKRKKLIRKRKDDRTGDDKPLMLKWIASHPWYDETCAKLLHIKCNLETGKC
jgi:hypothetical protein